MSLSIFFCGFCVLWCKNKTLLVAISNDILIVLGSNSNQKTQSHTHTSIVPVAEVGSFYCNSVFISNVKKNERCCFVNAHCTVYYNCESVDSFEWMCHIKQTWHKLPHITNVDWNIFIYSVDYLSVARSQLFKLQIDKNDSHTRRQRQRQREIETQKKEKKDRKILQKKTSKHHIRFWETRLTAQHAYKCVVCTGYDESDPLRSHVYHKSAGFEKKIDQPNAMHVCVFHLRLMMCHIYEVSDSGSLNDRQLSWAELTIAYVLMAKRYNTKPIDYIFKNSCVCRFQILTKFLTKRIAKNKKHTK